MSNGLCATVVCTRISTVRYMVTGQVGTPGKAGYCDTHAETFAKPSTAHDKIKQ